MDLGLYDLDYDKQSLDWVVKSGEDWSLPESSSSVCVLRLVHKNNDVDKIETQVSHCLNSIVKVPFIQN